MVREGINVSLECRPRGYPPPTVTWRKEDQTDPSNHGKAATLAIGVEHGPNSCGRAATLITVVEQRLLHSCARAATLTAVLEQLL